MNVVFLDVDGVLNSESYALKLEERHRALGHEDPARPKRETTCDCFKLYHQIDRDAVARVNRLVAVTASKIVISSSWRKRFDPPELERILVEHGLVAEIIGVTPDGHVSPEMLIVYGALERMYRGYEIDFWLRKHPEVDRFVILDDGSDMAMHKNRLVQTDCEEGLLDDHVELAIRVMSWDGKAIPVEEKVAPVRRTQNPKNAYRWDEIGGYIVSTIRLPRSLAASTGTLYETLVYSRAEGAWDADGSGVQSATEVEANAVHDAACDRIRGKIQ